MDADELQETLTRERDEALVLFGVFDEAPLSDITKLNLLLMGLSVLVEQPGWRPFVVGVLRDWLGKNGEPLH